LTLVFLNVTGSLGGAERVLLTLLGELRRLRPDWQLHVITGESGPLLDTLMDGGFTATVLALPHALRVLGDWGVESKLALFWRAALTLPAGIWYRHALRTKLHSLRPDVVQTNGFKMHVMGTLACPPGCRIIWHVHDFISNRTAMKALLRWLSPRPDCVAAISAAVAADLQIVVRRPEKIRTIWNSVDLSRFAPKPHPEREEAAIGLIATFARWKGHEVFLRALALLPDKLRWRALVVGGGVYSRAGSQFTEAELRTLSIQLGLEKKVEFTGFLKDPAPVIEALDIVVHASTEPEPFGLAIAEGMAAGRAVVTSSESLVTNGVDGLTHAPGSAADLARALEELLLDPILRKRLSTAARASAERRFQPERMAREFIALYETPA